ncbi:unnamed protein product [Chrysoparadoxa australica]
MPLVMAVDIGSTSIRCCAYAIGGGAPQLVEGSAVQLTMTVPIIAGEVSEILKMVDGAVDACIKKLRQQGLDASTGGIIKGVTIASLAMALVGVNRKGDPVTHLMSYREGGRGGGAGAASKRLRAEAGHSYPSMYQRTGAPCLHPAYAPAQLLQLSTDEPEVMQQVASWQTLASLAIASWCGRKTCPISYSEASWMGLLDVRELQWDKPLLQLLTVLGCHAGDMLPELTDYDEWDGQLCQQCSIRWPELKDAKFFLGVGDGACATIGSCSPASTDVAVTCGTSAAARVIVQAEPSTGGTGGAGGGSACGTLAEGGHALPLVLRGLWCYRIDRRRLLVGGALTDGGSVYSWANKLCGSSSSSSSGGVPVDEMPGSHGLTVLPFFSGERSPGWAEGATGVIQGLTLDTTLQEIVQAGAEAVAMRLAAVLEILDEAGLLQPQARVVASGAALRASKAWRQVLSNCVNRCVVLAGETEATSMGAARLAMEYFLPAKFEMPRVGGSLLSPDPSAVAVYRERRERQEELYTLLNSRSCFDF